ncbi:hypothetical protein BS47DRAFT_1427623 [Hydnum rufescens UP504]|uniref:SLA1 homology domain-containing protein n=1 Tax=Hydnum rufescens UP504 TaxID=1448309 RepID=A0A9P6E0E7_9AGAM|nr:hypothetical protein BS47DRAFT_1427623 [Hydnum rufescens UP504]
MSFKDSPPARTSQNTSHTVSMPAPTTPRAWHDRNGEFLAEAYYCGTVGVMIRLQETEGTFRDIPVSVLSREDIAYLNGLHVDQGIASAPPFYYPPTPSDSSDDLSADGLFPSTFPTPQVQYTLTMPQPDRFLRDQAPRRNQRYRPNIILTNAPDRAPQADIYSEMPHAEPPPYQPNNTWLSPYSRTDSDTGYFRPSGDSVTSTTQDQLSGDSVDWFKIFLDAGCEIQDCMRYEGVFRQLQVDSKAALLLKHNDLRAMGLDKDDIMRIMDAIGMNPKENAFSTGKGVDGYNTFAPLPEHTFPARANVLQAGSFGQSVAPPLNSTTVQEIRGIPGDGMSTVGEGGMAGSHRDSEIPNPFSGTRHTPKSTAVGSSIPHLLQTALPPLMPYGKPSLEGVSPSPFSRTASSTASRISMDNGISESAEPTKGRSSTSTQRGPFPRPDVARLTSLPSEFDPPELLRSQSIESFPDESQRSDYEHRHRATDTCRYSTHNVVPFRVPRKKQLPSHFPGFFGSRVPTPHPPDNQDLILAIADAQASADARLVAFIRRREIPGIKHEFVMIQARYPSSKTIWIRLERGVKGSISIFRLSRGVADDVV